MKTVEIDVQAVNGICNGLVNRNEHDRATYCVVIRRKIPRSC